MRRSHPTYAVLERLEQELPLLATKSIHFVWGMKDWCFRPSCMDRLQRSLPNATRCELEDVGHYVMEEAPDEVERELRNLIAR
jgi:haloalkane dehalogenase